MLSVMGDRTKWRENAVTGLLEEVDLETGAILSSEKPPQQKAEKIASGKIRKRKRHKFNPARPHEIVNRKGKVVPAKVGANPDDLPGTRFPYAQTTVDVILMHVTEGMTISKISKMRGMPPKHVIYGWLRRHPEFKAEFEQAKRDRAAYYHDAVIDTAESVEKKSDIPKAKLKMSAYKWGAQVGDPENYADTRKSMGKEEKPPAILIMTGVPLPGDQKAGEPIEVKAETGDYSLEAAQREKEDAEEEASG